MDDTVVSWDLLTVQWKHSSSLEMSLRLLGRRVSLFKLKKGSASFYLCKTHRDEADICPPDQSETSFDELDRRRRWRRRRSDALNMKSVPFFLCLQRAAEGAHHASVQLREQTVPPSGRRLHLWLDLQQQEQVTHTHMYLHLHVWKVLR